MKAAMHDVYGDASVVTVRDVAVPEPGAGEVLIRVHAAGLDRGVWHLLTGTPLMARLALGLRTPRQKVLGLDVAGVVERVGAGVTELAPGDRVFGGGTGTFAEFAIAKPKALAPMPAGLSFEQAAASPVSGLTALQALRKADPVAGKSVLIIGAGSGVGSFAIQLAKAQGATVTAVVSPGKIDFVTRLGADHVVDYTVDDLGDQRHDVILDIAGIRPIEELRRVLAPRGTVVFIGGEGGGPVLNGMQRQIGAGLFGPRGQKFVTLLGTTNTADLTALSEYLESGAVVPQVHQTYPLEQVGDALGYIGQGHATGKTVITVTE
jgi:NADPH:quinone reductase-like Zn-dependent oxidoreductase